MKWSIKYHIYFEFNIFRFILSITRCNNSFSVYIWKKKIKINFLRWYLARGKQDFTFSWQISIFTRTSFNRFFIFTKKIPTTTIDQQREEKRNYVENTVIASNFFYIFLWIENCNHDEDCCHRFQIKALSSHCQSPPHLGPIHFNFSLHFFIFSYYAEID